MYKSRELKKLINSDKTLIMPDAFNPISAQLIEKAGFKAVQCSGYSFSLAAGYEREVDVSLEENLLWTSKIVDSVDIPVMADAEDGYGEPEKISDTIARFMEIGVAGLNLEDQIQDVKETVSIVDEDVMVQKIIRAREVAEMKNNPEIIINSRTDALKSTLNREDGLEIAIERANQYLSAGADLAFITYVETLDEVKQITKEVKGPVSIAAGLPYNIKNFTFNDLENCGVARISLPTLLVLSSINIMEKALNYVKKDELNKFSY
jgi:2-methylisocitrate lyase-like PEP mutase family enzyme